MTNGNQLTPIEQLAFSTVRIETILNSGEIGTGTGFFYRLKEQDNTTRHIPVIVTNKHVIKDANIGRFKLTLQNSQGLPNTRNHININIDNFEQRWIHHPNPNIDLCVMPIAPLLYSVEQKGKKFFFITLYKIV